MNNKIEERFRDKIEYFGCTQTLATIVAGTVSLVMGIILCLTQNGYGLSIILCSVMLGVVWADKWAFDIWTEGAPVLAVVALVSTMIAPEGFGFGVLIVSVMYLVAKRILKLCFNCR